MSSGRSKFILLFILLLIVGTKTNHARAMELGDLRPGDVILVSLNCYVCKAISKTTLSPYNHSGLVLDAGDALGGVDFDKETFSGLRVAQSLGTTSTVTLDEFFAQVKNGSPFTVLRPKELNQLRDHDPARYAGARRKLRGFFNEQMLGRGFDDDYLWDNVDQNGRELLYCSEMIQKTLNHVLSEPLRPIGLDYSRMWEFWFEYFDGEVPQGLPGNSPASLQASDLMMTVVEGAVHP